MLRAMDSSEAERRRIARDLHDGVVQELAGTAFALSASLPVRERPPSQYMQIVPLRSRIESATSKDWSSR